MKEFIRLVVNLILDVYLSFFNRSKHIVVCSGWSGERFADNSRYIYLYLNANKLSLQLSKVVWLTNDVNIKQELRNAGFCVYMKNSFPSIYYHLRAKYFFYDQFSSDFFVFLTRKARLNNLWHGIPIKKFGKWDGLNWDLKNDYLLTCSTFGDNVLGGAFNLAPNHFIHGMYPRNHYLMHDIPFLTKEELKYMAVLKKYKNEGKKILFYLPTFRKSKLKFLGEDDFNVISGFVDFLNKNNYFLVTKMHYAGYYNHKDSVSCLNETFLNLSPLIDIYSFLKETDILITDYSSVLFDFLYLDRDIICYSYDLLEYQDFDRGFLLNYKELPADIVCTLEDLKNNLLLKKENRDGHYWNRKIWLEKCFENRTLEDTIQQSLS